MPKKILYRTFPGGVLVPENDEEQAKTTRWKTGSLVEGSFTESRNPQHHRKVMAMMQKLVDYSPMFKTVDDALEAVKLAIGHFVVAQTTQGHPYPRTKSIKFGAMDQLEFEEWHKKVKDVCLDGSLKEYFHGLTPEAYEKMENELLTFM